MKWTDEPPQAKGEYWWAPCPDCTDIPILVEARLLRTFYPAGSVVQVRRLQEPPDPWAFPKVWTEVGQAVDEDCRWCPVPRPPVEAPPPVEGSDA